MNLADFHFIRPWWLLALLPALYFCYYWLKKPSQQGNWLTLCDAELLPYLLDKQNDKQTNTGLILSSIVSLLAIIALAGPTWQRLPSPAFRNDTALVIVLDLSVTMDASDIKPSRLSKARYKIADLLKLRKDGQSALLVYSGEPFTVTPLTTDTATISSQLEALNTDIMPSAGHNTEKAIQKAVDLLQQAGVAQGDILLMTDSVESGVTDHAESLLHQYRLSVLAIGTDEGAPISQTGGGFVKDAAGNIVLARLDRQALSQLCLSGHGLLQMVSNDDTDVNHLQHFFDARVKQDSNQQNNILLQQWDELGPYLIVVILPWAAWQFRKGLLMFMLVCLLPMPNTSQAMDWQSLWLNANQRAVQAFKQENYQQAADEFSDPNWRAAAQYKAGDYQKAAETLKDTQTVDGYYNRGNALAKAGKLPEAIKAYDQALKLDPNHQDAAYNKDLVEKALKKQEQQDQQQKKDQDQQKSEKSEQQKSENDQSDQQKSEQQNPDDKQSDQDQQNQDAKPSDANKQDQANQPQKPANEKPESDKDADKPQASQQAEPSKPEKNQSQPDSVTESQDKPAEQSPQQRANEQLLKRIPDEPTGLLKRKFKHILDQHN